MSAETITTVVPQRETPAMHSFAEDQGQPPFDWNAFLDKPIRSYNEWREAMRLANNFVTCAVGNQCATIPRYNGHSHWSDGAPKDDRLHDLGMRFAKDIADCNIAQAKQTLAAIEARSAELLREMAAQP